MKYFIACWREWVGYTPFFFKNAPVNRWHTYFSSCYRVSTGLAYAKAELDKCGDDIWLRGARRIQMTDVAKAGLNGK